jgi:hypothetical protein
MAVSRLLGRFPARSLRFGNEDEAAEIIAEWMEWNVRGRWLGMDGFDYFAGLAALSTPYLGVASGADWIFAPPRRAGRWSSGSVPPIRCSRSRRDCRTAGWC